MSDSSGFAELLLKTDGKFETKHRTEHGKFEDIASIYGLPFGIRENGDIFALKKGMRLNIDPQCFRYKIY